MGPTDLISAVERMEVSNLPAMLSFLRLVTWAASSLPSRVAVEMEDSENMQALEEPEVPSTCVTVEQCLQLMVHEGYRRVQS